MDHHIPIIFPGLGSMPSDLQNAFRLFARPSYLSLLNLKFHSYFALVARTRRIMSEVQIIPACVIINH